jgi:hypothetical protein
MPRAWLKRARWFSQAIAAVSSTSCASSKLSHSVPNRWSGITAGVLVISAAYSRTNFTTEEKAALSRNPEEASFRPQKPHAPALRRP